MTARADVVELLRAGYGDRTIARHLQISRHRVAADRQALGIAPGKSGVRPAGSLEDLFWRRVKPVDGGHLEWTGFRTNCGTPAVKFGGRGGSVYTAYRVAFRIKYGRPPVGRVLATCDYRQCVMPGHHEDDVIRERTDATFAAIFGGAA